MASALALTYVPVFEGFGIPIVEAFSVGTPVITSNVTSMPEVASNAALLVNPMDEKTIAKCMQRISEDENLRKELIEKGLNRRKDFSWEYTANKLWEAIEKAMK